MGIGFRLDWKWAFPAQSPLLTNGSTRQHSYSFGGRDPSFESASVPVLYVIPEGRGMAYKDPLKAYTCYFSMNVGSKTHSTFSNTIENISMPFPESAPSYLASLEESSTSRFSLLMENIEKIEEIFVNSKLVRLEREILVLLEKLGALKVFHMFLSRTIKTSTIHDLPDAPTKLSKDHFVGGKFDDFVSNIIVLSRKKEERSRDKLASKSSALSSSLKTVHNGPQLSFVPTAKHPQYSRGRRLLITRDESEMARNVKELVNLERVRASLEGEIGQVVSYSRWAEAVGLDEKVLQQRLLFGWFCRDKLIRSTHSLVSYLAGNYRGMGVAYKDLIQAGNIGVLQGAERFDYARGYKFSTYVQYWIRKSMSTLVSQYSVGIQIPTSLKRQMNQIKRTCKALYRSHGRYPDDDEIASITGLSLTKISVAGKCLRDVGSINKQVADSPKSNFTEFTSDTSVKTPGEILMRQHMRQDIHELLQGLHPREKQVLMLRYGFWDGQCKSLEEIGRVFHVTKEWIRKIEKTALTKLRKEEVLNNLSQYLDL
ncbi:RNA polymerase sigma factor sigC [Telopea speciosissima]|uniref:RNA polymerase sigma factor sigC n=1 Tax=Telopea speciosissima TaxID=54955 RepID=UPI001CC57343|nr:RNA polymerase sigma factor sigC [Telopea speciosissima]